MDPLVLVIAALVCVGTVAAAVAARAAMAAGRATVLDRASRLTRGDRQDPAPSQGRASGWFKVLAPLARLARPKDPEGMSRLRTSLAYAGFRGARAVETFLEAKVALGLGLGGALLVASSLFAGPVPHAREMTLVLVAAGFYAPNLWLRRRGDARRARIGNSLADTIDVLVTCVEGGLGLDAALARITKEIGASAPELAGELTLTTAEMRAGIPRADAFRRLAARTGVEQLRSLAAMIVQSEMFGTSIARSLRVHSRSMRIRRTHDAEERAAKASVKMTIPLILCILPSLFAVILGPAIVRIGALLSHLGGR
jgi:tight adherence protein C